MPTSRNGSFSSTHGRNNVSHNDGDGDGDGGPHERVRVLPPAPPYAPGMEAIPSTVTTPTLLSHLPSFRLEGPAAALVVGDAREGNGGAGNGSFGGRTRVRAAQDREEALSDRTGPTHSGTAHGNGKGEDADMAASPTSAMEGGGATAAAAPSVIRPVNWQSAMIGYFGYMFGAAAIDPYKGVILKTEKHFSTTAVGLLVSAKPIFQIVLLPLLSFIADKYNCSAKMLSVCAVGSTIMVLLFTMAPTDSGTLVAHFVLIGFQTPMNPLLDKHTLLMFPTKGRTSAWGHVRSYGAYGWGVGNPVAGALVAWTHTWAVAAVQYAMGQAALLYCMYTTTPYEAIDHATSSSVRFKDVLDVLWQHPRLLLFLFASCMMGMGYSFINNFLFIFLSELGGSTILMGISLLVTVSTEIPIFQHSDRLHRWLTERQMMTCAMLIWSVRVVGYSFLRTPWLVLLLEPLHGVTFALMWLPGVKLISEVYPPKLASSATGVLFTFVNGFGAIIGNVFAGLLYDIVGARWMFRIAAAVMLSGLSIYQLLDRVLERKGHPLGKPSPNDDEGSDVATVVVAAVPADEEVEDGDKEAVGAVPATAATARNYSFNRWEERNVGR